LRASVPVRSECCSIAGSCPGQSPGRSSFSPGRPQCSTGFVIGQRHATRRRLLEPGPSVLYCERRIRRGFRSRASAGARSSARSSEVPAKTHFAKFALTTAPRESMLISRNCLICRSFFQRSGAGVEPTQPGAARPHRLKPQRAGHPDQRGTRWAGETRSPLPESLDEQPDPRPPPYHALRSAIGRSQRQRIWLD
jgi:hypothetical protein